MLNQRNVEDLDTVQTKKQRHRRTLQDKTKSLGQIKYDFNEVINQDKDLSKLIGAHHDQNQMSKKLRNKLTGQLLQLVETVMMNDN